MPLFTLLRAVAYKESIKTRHSILLLTLFNIAVLFWNFLSVRRLFMLDHSEVVWYRVMDLGQVPYTSLSMIPPLTALIFCAVQFLLEMRDARIRISLHTPCDSSIMVLAHAFYGILFLTTLFALDALLLFFTMHHYFPYEVAISAVYDAMPWFVSGLFVYLGGCFVLLEPQIKRKALGFILFGGMCFPLYLYGSAGFYHSIIWYFILCIPFMFLTMALPADDYRNRWS